MLSGHIAGFAGKKVQRTCFLLVIGFLVLYLLNPWRGQRISLRSHIEGLTGSDMCRMYPDDDDIAVILKTGATDNLDKLSATLNTSLRCVKNVTVLSDADQKFGNIQIHDVLARFSRQAMEGNPEFDIYWQIQDLVSQNREDELQSLSEIKQPPGRDWRSDGRSAAWSLDKYKWLHMLDLAWDLQPDRKWYVFVEPDTYVSWPNIKRWLSTLDETRKWYLGRAVQKSDDREPIYFAQGGSGVVFSGAVLKEFAFERRGIASRLDSRMHEWWAGDFTLADVLYDEMGLHVTQTLPMMYEHGSRSLPYSENVWCHPIIAMHHMKADDFDEVYKREQALGFNRLWAKDVYETVFPDGLPTDKLDWDNLAEAHEHAVEADKSRMPPSIDPNSDMGSCRIACESNPACFQFMFRNETVRSDDNTHSLRHSCVLSEVFRLGQPKAAQDFGQRQEEPGTYRAWHCGWMRERIAEWVSKHWDCGNGGNWSTDGKVPGQY